MDSQPIVSILIITSGNSQHVNFVYDKWVEAGYTPGFNLFISGPEEKISKFKVDIECIINYTDPNYSAPFFLINEKKLFSCRRIDSKYIYILHDRFIPSLNFKSLLENNLETENVDFGAVDVKNIDGSISLSELRLKESILGLSIYDGLNMSGRMVCGKSSAEASSKIAINGGQFFLKISCIEYLARPMRWMEMEDDILSYDLIDFKGKWFSEFFLTTIVERNAPEETISKMSKLKYIVYGMLCNLIAAILLSHSVYQNISDDRLRLMFKGKLTLIDPLHKSAASHFLPSSLEKIMARSRVLSSGDKWQRIEKRFLGWELS